MTNNPNELTKDNSVLVLIDHQPWAAFSVQSIDRGLMVNNNSVSRVISRSIVDRLAALKPCDLGAYASRNPFRGPPSC